MISANDLSPAELAALLHFHADAGVEWLLEEEAIDRFAEFEAMKAARRPAAAQAQQQRPTAGEHPAPGQAQVRPNAAVRPAPAERAASGPQPAIPDGEAVQQARFAAETARSLVELKTAIEAFSGCNLKHSARSTIFASGDAESGIMVIGSAPSAEDDREGMPFSGKSGQLFDKMLAAIGLTRSAILLTQVIPWRPPGNRAPSAAEMDICRPFIERQIALAEPKAILLLGNFSARFFFGENDTIHGLRGRWKEIAVADCVIPAIASLHPQDLLTAPVNKRLAWNDLLAFQAKLKSLSLLRN
ncbi:uracil-DNA glycosylase family protein [Rhizobium leguminosarum]|uniref:Type-4 uracil-DNA glycosylase n=2 Tax=Rhizobium leguminosarum TaxID=384 RepID=A0A154ICX7_RHILE|nr:uracil-DNA glycosylase [Rhizobium leguminosarum]KZA97967.1 uracil-DNA glycosylase [Rhizobium leguminosarum]NKK63326.1 uracil-DNA glycosylase [Rhizobium leguminosarum bv. viciae]NKL07149.1 uracil-DNA glycosylase [Rhizobium leguminosarum bv. viciae]NKL86096.1 uracil-DNA glycosylase [Rhizobium leguminosarum bv. viciae]NKL89782.1 uracil-DNA glycosylase [Rhizobium leguminosarum bv. viciae]